MFRESFFSSPANGPFAEHWRVNMKIVARRIRPLLVGACFAVVGCLSLPTTAHAAVPAEEQVASPNELDEQLDQIIVKFRDSAVQRLGPLDLGLQQTQLSLEIGMALRPLRSMSGGSHVFKLPKLMPKKDVEAATGKLSRLPSVLYAEPDTVLHAHATPNDPFYTTYLQQWHYYEAIGGVNLPTAWNVTTGSPGVVIAVLDTGLVQHADMTGRTVPGYDFVITGNNVNSNDGNGRDSDPSDPGDWCGSSSLSSWHGTHVAGTIGAATNNNQFGAGVNWSSRIEPVRVLGQCGGNTSDIADAIRWAAGLAVSGVPANANPARILNLSLGGGGSCQAATQSAINDVVAAGAVVVVSAGNSGTNAAGTQPANCNGVITVAATDRGGSRSVFRNNAGVLVGSSNFGTTVEISAPGGETFPNTADGVLSIVNSGQTTPIANGDAYNFYQGTSMSSPHISGVVSLMRSVNPTLTPAQVLQILQTTARPFPTGSDCSTTTCGAGIVDATAAVRVAISPILMPIVNFILSD
jgi:serine protease